MLSLSAISLEPDYEYKKTDRDLQISVVGKEREKQREREWFGVGVWERGFYSPLFMIWTGVTNVWPHYVKIVMIYHPEGLTGTHTYYLPSCTFCWGMYSFLLFIDSYQHFLISAEQNNTYTEQLSLGFSGAAEKGQTKLWGTAHAFALVHIMHRVMVYFVWCQ